MINEIVKKLLCKIKKAIIVRYEVVNMRNTVAIMRNKNGIARYKVNCKI